MKESSFIVSLALLGVISLVVWGCGGWFGNKQANNHKTDKQNTEQSVNTQNSDQLGNIKNNLAKLCFFVGENPYSTRGNPYYFWYQFSDKGNCTSTTAEDIIKGAFSSEMRKYDSLGIAKVEKHGKTKETSAKVYQQYYKGIQVESYTIRFNYLNNRVISIAGTYFPNIDIDTTGMISREEAARVVLRQRGIPDSLHAKSIPQMLQFSNFGLLPNYNKIFYSFRLYVGDKPGTYIVNAVSGRFHSYVPLDLAHVCYKCVAGNTQSVTCPSNSCGAAPSTTSYLDYRPLDAPTLYNGCQTIRIDSCFIVDTVYYRLSPRLTASGSVAYSPNDSINIFDRSIVVGGNIELREERFCHKDSITAKNVAASSLFYGLNLSRDYFKDKQIDRQKRCLVWAHMPSPEQYEAQYSTQYDLFLFGGGDNTNVRPLVSPDIVAHEYGHAVLSHVFEINRDSVHINQPQVKAIHEGVSDVFSVLARRYAYGTVDWTIGNEVMINPVGTLPRDLAHPENTLQPQALYYNDPANNWSTDDEDIYNHAGIIVKWFYLMTNGGIGANFTTDNITVQALGIDTAEMVLIAGLDTLKGRDNKVPSYEDFCQATTRAANALFPPLGGTCSPEVLAVRDAWRAVGKPIPYK